MILNDEQLANYVRDLTTGELDLLDTIADLKRQLAERKGLIIPEKAMFITRQELDAYVQEKVDQERREVSDWIDAYAKSEGLTITLETKTTEERIRALCTLLSAKAAHEQDRAVLEESKVWNDKVSEWADEHPEFYNWSAERLAANRAKLPEAGKEGKP